MYLDNNNDTDYVAYYNTSNHRDIFPGYITMIYNRKYNDNSEYIALKNKIDQIEYMIMQLLNSKIGEEEAKTQLKGIIPYKTYKKIIEGIIPLITSLINLEGKYKNKLYRHYEHEVENDFNCIFCLDKIKQGDKYIEYRPLIYNIETGEKKTIVYPRDMKVCEKCQSKIPSNIKDFEELLYQIEEYQYNYSDVINNEQIEAILNCSRDGFVIKSIDKEPINKPRQYTFFDNDMPY